VKISRVRIEGYRCVQDISLEVGDYTALIGPNGAGKSSLLYALDWFFNGGTMTPHDLHKCPNDAGASPETPRPVSLTVEVTFIDLSEQDRQALGLFGRGDAVRLTRGWSSIDGKEVIFGESREGPGFSAVRKATPVAEMRQAYGKLRKSFPELPDTPTREAISNALTTWEETPWNVNQLVAVGNVEATHLFTAQGGNLLRSRVRYTLIPASADLAGQLGVAGRGSALANLIGNIISNTVSTARKSWEEEHAAEIGELNASIKKQLSQATTAELVPNASITFSSELPSWSLKGDSSLRTEIAIDGTENDISRQGHGVQRAVMMAMLQSLVEAQDDQLEPSARPTLVVAIEEPEIYQHPVRARHFARSLTKLSQQENSQVLIATHSPYFVRPDQFDALRRVRLVNGRTMVSSTTVDNVTARAKCDRGRVLKLVEKELPRNFSEGFFADAVVLVEGDTDKVILETTSEIMGLPLDAAGIAILSVESKNALDIPYQLLSELGIPTYVLADGDAGGALRRYPDDMTKQKSASGSHRLATETIIGWLPTATAIQGSLPYAFGDPTIITDQYTIFHDDIETELEQWPSFVAALTAAGGQLREKNVATYRSAASDASECDIPASIRALVGAIVLLKS